MALPVAGDSYVLLARGKAILVDGGHSSRTLAAALLSPDVAVNQLDIVVCSHADADHAGGLVDLLERSPIRVGEVWLPGAWGDVIPKLFSNPREVVDSLLQEMEIWQTDLDGSSYQDEEEFEAAVHSRIAKERSLLMDRPRDVLVRDLDKPDSEAGIRWLREQLPEDQLDRKADAAAAKEFVRGRRLAKRTGSTRGQDDLQQSLWARTIKTAERIRQIALQAVRHNVPVRWFDFGEFARRGNASGGWPGLLVPVNAVELVHPPKPVEAMAYLARLTPVNEECLVFRSDLASSWPLNCDVIFTGDSPLGFGTGYTHSFVGGLGKRGRFVVATAPHHGSESNSVAYAHLEETIDVALWLRSGGSSRHPGPTFRRLDPATRLCTSCPHRKHVRKLAVIHLAHPRWWPIRTNGHECNC